MTVYRNEGKYDKSNIEFESQKILNYDKKNFDNKMEYIDYGLGILTAKAFGDFEGKDEFDLEQVYKKSSELKMNWWDRGKRKYFMSLVLLRDLKETNKYLLMNND